ncbi:hypothetical protein [uncultured Olegusella sp.]|uniref:hypothetical protein n=1 Tax=uncultured Olegusella sp. TaxID=1979846 RepID=UPI00261D5598|nr:hypothetical protein [uncultured Olegusella sp.]
MAGTDFLFQLFKTGVRFVFLLHDVLHEAVIAVAETIDLVFQTLELFVLDVFLAQLHGRQRCAQRDQPECFSVHFGLIHNFLLSVRS